MGVLDPKRKSGAHGAGSAALSVPDDLIARADEAEAEGRYVEAVDLLQQANRLRPDGEVEVRLIEVRDRSFATLDHSGAKAFWPPAYPDLTPGVVGLPEIGRDELDEAALGSGITHHGAVLVRCLLDSDEVAATVSGIDDAFVAYDSYVGDPSLEPGLAPTFARYRPSSGYPDSKMVRSFVRESGGVWAADCPHMMFELLDLFERKGLIGMITGYFGERPALSAKKCTLRRLPVDAGMGWHQDGSFMGEGIRTVDVWIALTDCGGPDSEVPALDVVPKRFDHIVERGTEGAPFPWFVGPGMAEELAGDLGIQRPRFRAGDALMFDDLFLHTTAVTPDMVRPRYAIEAWFFAPSVFPEEQVPLLV